MQVKLKHIGVLLSLAGMLAGCGEEKAAPTAIEMNAEAGTPVTITSISTGPLTESMELNATSAFQLKTFIKANATGYLQSVNAQLGRFINRGQEVFIIKTKEAEALGNTINVLDSSFRFTGIIHIKSPGTGYVTTLNYRDGDYVTDGEQLAIISDKNSFCFLLDLPYELKPFLSGNKNVLLKLPDGTQLNGYVASQMPTVDPVSQTQSIVIKVNNSQQIPEGLIAKVILVKKSKPNALSLPKDAVLTNETQSEFWVMKLIDSVTAVKVPIKKGLENSTSVEVLSPQFSMADKILLTGNYGLGDTAKVTIQQ
ncbi:MAG: efflux RND transporter periplasmic adaptor subunit [Chitinophagaceae bacterium]|jgi:multidrug efflux pump subunit AcrA (membrane-fusion protein)|nr:efflux RND transporter periplasmic adaptor subunit [Chitinophagaceae bacterium]